MVSSTREKTMPDHLTPQQRRRAMTNVKVRDGSLEVLVRSALHKRGLRFRKHVRQLPGRPDLVFPKEKVATFIDGDFWHGYRFPSWEQKLPDFWRKKIAQNRVRDRRNFRRLKNMGWIVLRIWQHEVKQDLDACISRVLVAIGKSPSEK